MPSLLFSLREHETDAGYYPTYTFTKQTATILRQTSYPNASIGMGYIFIVVPRAWLHGKYIRFNWEGYCSYPNNAFSVLIYDGSYDRSSDTDFPTNAGKLIKGAGLLQTLVTKGATFSAETKDVQADVDGGTQEMCTIFFQLRDGWSGYNYWMQIDWFEINQYANGVGNLYNEHFTDSVHMEVTGTYNDYGYISAGYVAIYVISGVTRDANGNPLGGCTVWLFRTSDKVYLGVAVSNGNGNYILYVADTTTEHFVRAYKDGTPNVFGTTDRNLKGV